MEAETYPFIANAEKIFLESMHAWRGGLKTSGRGIAVLSMCIDKVLCVQTLFVEEKFPGHKESMDSTSLLLWNVTKAKCNNA